MTNNLKDISRNISGWGKNSKAKVNFLGKFKTFFQFFSIGVAMFFLDTEFFSIVEVVVIIAAVLSWLSFLNYSYEKS